MWMNLFPAHPRNLWLFYSSEVHGTFHFVIDLNGLCTLFQINKFWAIKKRTKKEKSVSISSVSFQRFQQQTQVPRKSWLVRVRGKRIYSPCAPKGQRKLELPRVHYYDLTTYHSQQNKTKTATQNRTKTTKWVHRFNTETLNKRQCGFSRLPDFTLCPMNHEKH